MLWCVCACLCFVRSGTRWLRATRRGCWKLGTAVGRPRTPPPVKSGEIPNADEQHLPFPPPTHMYTDVQASCCSSDSPLFLKTVFSLDRAIFCYLMYIFFVICRGFFLCRGKGAFLFLLKTLRTWEKGQETKKNWALLFFYFVFCVFFVFFCVQVVGLCRESFFWFLFIYAVILLANIECRDNTIITYNPPPCHFWRRCLFCFVTFVLRALRLYEHAARQGRASAEVKVGNFHFYGKVIIYYL